MKMIGNEKLSPSWSKELEDLIVCAITGGRCGVVEKLDALVKGYRPDYEYHGIAVPASSHGTSVGTSSAATPLEPDLPLDPAPPLQVRPLTPSPSPAPPGAPVSSQLRKIR